MISEVTTIVGASFPDNINGTAQLIYPITLAGHVLVFNIRKKKTSHIAAAVSGLTEAHWCFCLISVGFFFHTLPESTMKSFIFLQM